MKTFLEYLKEATSPTKVSILGGRFQPWHIGHTKIVEMMKFQPLILIVKGKGSSEDKSKNPLDEEYQEYLIKKVFPNAEVVKVRNMNLKPIVYHTQKGGDKVVGEILGGPDRLGSYKNQLVKEYPDIIYTETPRITSATAVRQAIRDGDEKTFKKLMPPRLHSEWNQLRKQII